MSALAGGAWWPGAGRPGGQARIRRDVRTLNPHEPRIAQPTTLAMIASIRKWAEAALGAPSVLVIERVGARNRVALRFSLGLAICECDVATLRALHKKRLRQPALRRELLRACGCADVSVQSYG